MLGRARATLFVLGMLLWGCGPAVEVDPALDAGSDAEPGDSTGGGAGGAGGGTTGGSGGSGGATSTGGSGGATSAGGSGGVASTGGGGVASTGGSGGGDCADEECDGVDNDCDGLVDEGDNPCGGVCPLPAPGMPCDGPDTDLCADDTYACDGPNSVVCSAGPDAVEVCNGLDDDCDLAVDEGSNGCGGACPLPALGTLCDGPDVDLCLDDTYVCGAPNSVVCDTGTDTVEECNGLDDDCDGGVDEGNNGCGGVCPLPAPGTPCDGSDTDLCTDDSHVCDGPNSVLCTAGTNNFEICNGQDDDCDGIVDEGGANMCGGACLLPQGSSTCDGPDTDQCVDDIYVCNGLNSKTCGTGPNNVEICNGLDDDCNGAIDDNCVP